MMKSPIKRLIFRTLLSISAISAEATNAQDTYELNISVQPLSKALKVFAAQSNLQVVYYTEIAEGQMSNRVSGNLTAQAALRQLLQNTGLTFFLVDERTIAIEKAGENTSETNQNTTNIGEKISLEEIIVTAEKREQNLQEVPVAISAFTEKMLEARGIATPQDLQFSTPGLTAGSNEDGAQVTIRGVGTENTSAGGDPGVPVHINGHYTQSTAYIFRDFLDVERVEVQRGPQGTLYGRNAVGGNINIITKRPTDSFEGSLSVDFGNYEKRHTQVVVSGPLGERLRGRIAASDEKRDGYVTDLNQPSETRENSDYTSFRGAVLFDLTDAIEIYLNAYSFNDKASRANWRLSDGVDLSDPFTVSTNSPSAEIDESEGASVDISWDAGAVEFRTLTAYDETRRNGVSDGDGTAFFNFDEFYSNQFETLSQEFQLLSGSDTGLKWVAGAFYYKERSSSEYFAFYDESALGSDPIYDLNGDGIYDANDPRLGSLGVDDIEASSTALYGQVDYALSQQLEVIVGLRYTKDEKSNAFYGTFFSEADPSRTHILTPSPNTYNNTANWEEATWKLGLKYFLVDDAILYASYSRGYKAGGLRRYQTTVYDPEVLDAYELGLKSRWFQDRLQVNLAAFYYDYDDKQELQRLPPAPGRSTVAVRNAASARSIGLEVEIQTWLTDSFMVDMSLGYMNPEYKDFRSIDFVRPDQGPIDLTGNKIPQSPEWKVHIGAEYTWYLQNGLGSILLRGDYSWVDDQWADAFNRDGTFLAGTGDLIPAYKLVNVRLQWESGNNAWLASLYAKNLTDEIILLNTNVYSTSVANNFYNPPRAYGVKLTYQF